MEQVQPAQLTRWDRIRGYFNPEYAARTALARTVQNDAVRFLMNSVRGAVKTRTDSSWAYQPFGVQTRTLTAGVRREAIKRARHIDENNILGSSLLDRVVDNVIGERMTVQAQTGDPAWNDRAEHLWNEEFEHEADIRGLDTFSGLQRKMYRAKGRDAAIGAVLIASGQIQPIECDHVQSPFGGGDQTKTRNVEIIDGIEVNAAGRPLGFWIVENDGSYRGKPRRIAAQNFVWDFNSQRLDKTALHGYPILAMIGPHLDQIHGTIEAVVMAHRMAAAFGLIHKRKSPGSAWAQLPNTATNAQGNTAKAFRIEPGMTEFIGADDDITQVKPEHPHTSFSEFMTFLIRMAGIKFGLPLELALMDFSRTNYSSARASMEQSYRRFRIEQRSFSRNVLTPIYRWRISKWIKEGRLEPRDDAWNHKWFGQQWPYLDPAKDAIGSLVAIDAGLTTLSDELMKRGVSFEEWLITRSREVQEVAKSGIPVMHSTSTRDPGGAVPTRNTADEDESIPNG